MRAIVACILLAGVVGCGKKAGSGAGGKENQPVGKDVTAKEIETFGKELVGKPCVMRCKFQMVSDTWVRNLLRDDRFVGFFVIDSKGEQFQFVFADKEKHGRKLIAMNRGENLLLIGKVQTVESSVRTKYYAFMVEEIQN